MKKNNLLIFIIIKVGFLFFSTLWAVDVPLFYNKNTPVYYNIKKLLVQNIECNPDEEECYIEDDECNLIYEACIEECEEDDNKCLEECDNKYNECINSKN